MSYSSSLTAGANTMNSWIGNYKQAKQEKIQGQVGSAIQELKAGRDELNAEGEMIHQQLVDFDKLSPSDMTTAVLNQIKASGGKIDDQTYSIVDAYSQNLVQVRDKYKLFNGKLELQNLKEQKLKNSIVHASRITDARVNKYNRPSVTGGGSTNKPSGNNRDSYLLGRGWQKYRGRWTNDAQKDWINHNKENNTEKWGVSKPVKVFAEKENIPLNSKEDLVQARKLFYKKKGIKSGNGGGSLDDLASAYTDKPKNKFKVGNIYKQNGVSYKYTEDGKFIKQ